LAIIWQGLYPNSLEIYSTWLEVVNVIFVSGISLSWLKQERFLKTFLV